MANENQQSTPTASEAPVEKPTSTFKKIARVSVIVLAPVVGVTYFHMTGRKGIQEFLEGEGLFKDANDTLHSEYQKELTKLVEKGFTPGTRAHALEMRKASRRLINQNENDISKVLENAGYSHAIDYVRGGSKDLRAKMLMNAGGATAVTMGVGLSTIGDDKGVPAALLTKGTDRQL